LRSKLARILFFIAFLIVNNVNAATLQNDSIFLLENGDSLHITYQVDTVRAVETEVSTSTFQPDPEKSVWLAAIVPGLGQIYNRQYWKVPIIYGGAMGLAYGITWNDRRYVDYRKGYVDLLDTDPNTNYFIYLLPEGVTLDSSNKSYYTRIFKTKLDTYRRNRDLCIIASAALYLLSIIDAYVDAQMFDYDISPDLSLEVTPTVIAPSSLYEQDSSVGLSCKLKF
jgi:hypothetical protein